MTNQMPETVTPVRERRYVYGGEPRPTSAGYAPRPNRRTTGRKVSTFNIILALFALGIGIVVYVGNILAVNHLAADIGRLEARLEEIRNTNDELRSIVSRKAALETIGTRATEELGMQHPQEQPVWIDVEELWQDE